MCQCRLAVGRIKLQRNKKIMQLREQRKEVAELLKSGKQVDYTTRLFMAWLLFLLPAMRHSKIVTRAVSQDFAKIRVEGVIRENLILQAYEARGGGATPSIFLRNSHNCPDFFVWVIFSSCLTPLLTTSWQILELYIELVTVRATLIAKTKEIPRDMVEAISSIIYSAQRIGCVRARDQTLLGVGQIVRFCC